jgi:acetyl esterase
VGESRALAEQEARELSGPGPAIELVEDFYVEGPQARVPVRRYVPAAALDGGVIVYCHGGGWVVGSVDGFDALCRRLALAASATVVSVGYRLAPEHPFPAALDDMESVVAWAAEALHTGADAPSGPLVLAGDSAGGNLAAVAARRHRDDVALQALIYPALDPTMSYASYEELGAGDYGLTRAGMAWYWEQYLQGADPADPDVAPLRARDLGGCPPAWILTAEYDPLRNEGEAYAAALDAAGVPVRLRRWLGAVHGFARWFAKTGEAAAAIDELGAAVRAVR